MKQSEKINKCLDFTCEILKPNQTKKKKKKKKKKAWMMK